MVGRRQVFEDQIILISERPIDKYQIEKLTKIFDEEFVKEVAELESLKWLLLCVPVHLVQVLVDRSLVEMDYACVISVRSIVDFLAVHDGVGVDEVGMGDRPLPPETKLAILKVPIIDGVAAKDKVLPAQEEHIVLALGHLSMQELFEFEIDDLVCVKPQDEVSDNLLGSELQRRLNVSHVRIRKDLGTV